MSPRAGKAAILIGFFALCAAAFVWAGGVVAETKRQATITDQCLQSAAWLMLCYASEHDGKFPESEKAYWDFVQTVMDAGTESNACTSIPQAPQGDGWPATSEAAGATMLEAIELPEVRKRVTVSVAGEPGKPPIIATPGKPSGLGTLEKVNGWVESWGSAPHEPSQD